CETHCSPASRTKPPRHQYLIRNRPRKYVAQHFQRAKRLVVPQLCHLRHQQQRNPHDSRACNNHPSSPDTVNYRPREQPKGQSDNQESQKKSLRDLCATKPQGFHKRSIKNRKAIKDNSDYEKKIIPTTKKRFRNAAATTHQP